MQTSDFLPSKYFNIFKENRKKHTERKSVSLYITNQTTYLSIYEYNGKYMAFDVEFLQKNDI